MSNVQNIETNETDATTTPPAVDAIGNARAAVALLWGDKRPYRTLAAASMATCAKADLTGDETATARAILAPVAPVYIGKSKDAADKVAHKLLTAATALLPADDTREAKQASKAATAGIGAGIAIARALRRCDRTGAPRKGALDLGTRLADQDVSADNAARAALGRSPLRSWR